MRSTLLRPAAVQGAANSSVPKQQRVGARRAWSSVAIEWPDPEGGVALRSQSEDRACAFETGLLWPLRMAKRLDKWATRGGKRRNTAAYGHAISLGTFTMALVICLDEAGSVSWRSRARRLVDSSAARRLDAPSDHWPSGRGPGSGFTSQREIGSRNPAGGGFVWSV